MTGYKMILAPVELFFCTLTLHGILCFKKLMIICPNEKVPVANINREVSFLFWDLRPYSPILKAVLTEKISIFSFK